MLKSVFENTSYIVTSRIITKILYALLVVFIGRKLGVEALGVYGFIISLSQIIFLFVAMPDKVALRELVLDKKKTGEYLFNLFYLRILLVILSLIILVLVANIHPMAKEFKPMIYIFGLYMALGCFADLPVFVFKVYRKFKFFGIGKIIGTTITVSLSLLFLFQGKSILWVFYAYLISMIPEMIYYFYILFKYFWKFKLERLRISLMKRWLKKGYYFLLQKFVGEGAFNLIILIISLFIGSYSVGIYYASFKIIDLVYFIYKSFMMVLYPYYASFKIGEKIKEAYITYRNYSLIFALLASLSLIFTSRFIVSFIYGDGFSESVILIRIFSLGIVFSILNRNRFTFLNAIKKEKINLLFLMLSSSMYIIMSVLLINFYSLCGVAVSEVISILFYFLMSSIYLKKIL